MKSKTHKGTAPKYSIKYKGKIVSPYKLAQLTGISYDTIMSRIYRGWNPTEELLSLKPAKSGRPRKKGM